MWFLNKTSEKEHLLLLIIINTNLYLCIIIINVTTENIISTDQRNKNHSIFYI